MLHSQAFLHHFTHDFDGVLEVEAFARAHVQLQGNGIQLLLAGSRQVRPLGQVLADQEIDVFVAATLPRAVWIAEVNGHTPLLRDLNLPCHLPPLVVGHALAHRQRHAVQRDAKALHRRSRRRVVHLDQHQVAAGTFNQRTDRRDVVLALDQITPQCPGTKRSSISGGRTWMLTISGIWPRRSTPPERGLRVLFPSGDKQSPSIWMTNSKRSLPGSNLRRGRQALRRTVICCWATWAR